MTREIIFLKNHAESEPGKLQPWTKLVETKVENPVNSRNDSSFQIPNSQISMLNLAKFCFQKPKTLQTTLIWRERGFFTEK